MKFTEYIWNLYKHSEKGKTELLMFGMENIENLSLKFEFELMVEFLDENDKLEKFYPYKELFEELENGKINDFNDAKNLFNEIAISPIVEEEQVKYNWFFNFIGAFSTALYHRFPNYFLPYYFTKDNYSDFLILCENFGITLPPNPNRNSQEQRAWFYFEICETLHMFRIRHNIPAAEFPAFLYCFGIESLEKIEETELPKPSRVYFLGAGAGFAQEKDNPDFEFLDNSSNQSTNTWGAGGLKIKKGDLVLMYCLSPRKYIHSIWRAIDDSFIDPFSHYYYGVKVGFPQKIKHITFQELKDNPIFRGNSTVRANMQGLNGKPLTTVEFSELLKMIEIKGQSINDLPKLPVYERGFDKIENERDVEIQLIEPLLKDLNFNENDWIRQLPIRMGRQTKYYPDYAILASSSKGKEKAKIILEAKYSVSSDKQLEEAFLQARSYGLRLRSEKIILADRDFVWVYEKQNGDFEFNPVLKLHWNELINSDNLYRLKLKL
ncbi:hypothetical protein [Mangrovibacterium sp.]|uniref:hypothetical protein n=1 Tax=Mangrovibacterium sp. TaxID=1961364 RepID=UPI003563F8EF